MVFTRSKNAAGELSRQIRDREFEKDYQAVLTGWLPQDEGTWRDFLKKDPETNCSCVVPEAH